MEMRSTLTNKSGQQIEVLYRDIESEDDLRGQEVRGVHAYCFCEDKLVVVYSEKKGYWTLPGGRIEKGETIGEAVIREVKEETNMQVLEQYLFGFQEIVEPHRILNQTKSFCIVEPYGPFVQDPDGGEITKIALIDPQDHAQYVDWGVVGDYCIKRALELKVRRDVARMSDIR